VRFHPRLATWLVGTCVVGCSSYHTIADPATALQPSRAPAHSVRVTKQDGQRFTLEDPVVDGDSLRGRSLNGRVTTLALADVAMVEVSKTNVVATVAVAAGSVAMLYGVIFLVTFDMGS